MGSVWRLLKIYLSYQRVKLALLSFVVQAFSFDQAGTKPFDVVMMFKKLEH
jgi:hypothetical protein